LPITNRLAAQHKVFAAFALYAFTMGSVYPRFAEVMSSMGVEESVFGLSLIGAPVGTFLALTFASPLIERVGFRRVLLFGIPATGLFYALAVQISHPLFFFLLLIPAGIAIGCLEIVINVEADRTEALLKRRIMNRAHSFWSFGFFGAGLSGACFAYFEISPQLHLIVIFLLIIPIVILLLGDFTPAPSRGNEAEAPRFALPTLPILILVVVTVPAMLMEGAGLDWSAIYMDKTFASSAFMAGIAVAVVTLSQAITRYFADGFVEKYSPVAVGRALLLLLAAGILLVLFPVSVPVALLGFAVMGIGTSVLFPLAMSAAAQRTDRSATVNVAALAQISFCTFLLGPPLLGFVAEHWGIHWVYGCGLPFIIGAFIFVNSLGAVESSKRKIA
jgi:MFS family permease